MVSDEIAEYTRETGLLTGLIRRAGAKVFRKLENKDINVVLEYCEALLEERNWELGVVAYDWAYRVRKQYTEETFYIFERWLKEYVTGWGDCDDFCTHAFGELLIQYPVLFEKVEQWTKCSEFWVRRGAAVVLILPIRKQKYDFNPFVISDSLMLDSCDLVQKGYGWMLKIYSTVEKDKVIEYLNLNKSKMPRTAFRYALEKLDKEERNLLMGKI